MTNTTTVTATLASEIQTYLWLLPPALGDALTSALYGQASAGQMTVIRSHAASHGSKSLFSDLADMALEIQR